MESPHEMQSVELERKGIDDYGVKTLANGLKENTTVTDINFCSNEIRVKGASALADVLRVNTTVMAKRE
jgi:hypothetical protein